MDHVRKCFQAEYVYRSGRLLNDRNFDYPGSDSSFKHMQFGVPQGSILGPLLFVIYINGLPGISNLADFILYADDANIIISGENIYEVEEQLDRLTGTLVEWVNANGLLLNLRKTNYMLFS